MHSLIEVGLTLLLEFLVYFFSLLLSLFQLTSRRPSDKPSIWVLSILPTYAVPLTATLQCLLTLSYAYMEIFPVHGLEVGHILD